MAHDVFISYSQKDKATADAICHHLESQSIRCWMAPRDIPYGKDWSEAIIEGMESSRVMVFVFSANANESPQVRREVQCAFERDVMVIPFRVENVNPAKGLAYYLSSVHWLDALTPPLENYLKDLSDRLKKVLCSESLHTPNAGSSDGSVTPDRVCNRAIPDCSSEPAKTMTPVRKMRGTWLQFTIGSILLGIVLLCGLFVLNKKGDVSQPELRSSMVSNATPALTTPATPSLQDKLKEEKKELPVNGRFVFQHNDFGTTVEFVGRTDAGTISEVTIQATCSCGARKTFFRNGALPNGSAFTVSEDEDWEWHDGGKLTVSAPGYAPKEWVFREE